MCLLVNRLTCLMNVFILGRQVNQVFKRLCFRSTSWQICRLQVDRFPKCMFLVDRLAKCMFLVDRVAKCMFEIDRFAKYTF